jgi:hypothetical protein
MKNINKEKEEERKAKEEEKKAKEKALRVIHDRAVESIKKSIRNFIRLFANTNDIDFAASFTDIPEDIAIKLRFKTEDEMDEAYNIYLGVLLDKAVAAIKIGKGLSEVKLETGLSLLVLREIEKAPDETITEELFKKYALIAWYPEEIDE